MIESACRVDRTFNGPAAYHGCVRQQLAALEATPGKPSFAGVSSNDQAMIESACRVNRTFNGPAAYYGCVRQQLAALEATPGRPSFAGVSSNDQAMIESACRVNRTFNGPAAYYRCLLQQLAAVSRQQNPEEQISRGSAIPGATSNQTSSQKHRGSSLSSKQNEPISQSPGKLRCSLPSTKARNRPKSGGARSKYHNTKHLQGKKGRPQIRHLRRRHRHLSDSW